MLTVKRKFSTVRNSNRKAVLFDGENSEEVINTLKNSFHNPTEILDTINKIGFGLKDNTWIVEAFNNDVWQWYLLNEEIFSEYWNNSIDNEKRVGYIGDTK